jgi:hypothetical protein
VDINKVATVVESLAFLFSEAAKYTVSESDFVTTLAVLEIGNAAFIQQLKQVIHLSPRWTN